MVQPRRKTVWRFLKKLKIELPNNVAIPLLGKHLEKTNLKRYTNPLGHSSTIYSSQDTPKSLQMVTAAMKLKDAYSLEEKL